MFTEDADSRTPAACRDARCRYQRAWRSKHSANGGTATGSLACRHPFTGGGRNRDMPFAFQWRTTLLFTYLY
jgi:hypothetical protein